jgi:inorganic pyrophosphatase
MSISNVAAGNNVPIEFNVIIEIPMNADPIKYEVDKESGALFVDRFMMTAMHYPANYGYVPRTIADDNDPVDVLVHTPFPLLPGVVVRCRALGLLQMDDEAGGDAKLLAVPTDGICPLYMHSAFLRALQGSRSGQMGQGHGLGRPRRCAYRDSERHQAICSPEGATSRLTRSTLSQAEQALRTQPMLRISRSCLVNVNHVREVNRTLRGDFILVLAGGAIVTSSEGFRSRVKEYLSSLRISPA